MCASAPNLPSAKRSERPSVSRCVRGNAPQAAQSEIADYLLVVGSGKEFPGTAALISATSHCGRT